MGGESVRSADRRLELLQRGLGDLDLLDLVTLDLAGVVDLDRDLVERVLGLRELVAGLGGRVLRGGQVRLGRGELALGGGQVRLGRGELGEHAQRPVVLDVLGLHAGDHGHRLGHLLGVRGSAATDETLHRREHVAQDPDGHLGIAETALGGERREGVADQARVDGARGGRRRAGAGTEHERRALQRVRGRPAGTEDGAARLEGREDAVQERAELVQVRVVVVRQVDELAADVTELGLGLLDLGGAGVDDVGAEVGGIEGGRVGGGCSHGIVLLCVIDPGPTPSLVVDTGLVFGWVDLERQYLSSKLLYK